MPVSKFDSPTSVPPPIIVPDTLSNFPLYGFTLIIETPLPIDTSNLFFVPEKIEDIEDESLYTSY